MPRKAASPKPDYQATVGDDGLAGGAVPPGTTITVAGVYPPGTPGVGDTEDGSDAVVIEWTEPAIIQGENGPEVGDVVRSMSVPASTFTDQFYAGGQ